MASRAKNTKIGGQAVTRADNGRVVLVGTYRGDQLTKWHGWYNYPISGNGELGTGNGRAALRRGRECTGGSPSSATDYSKINELWLFKGTKEERRFKAEFVGIKTRQELIRDYGYPAKGKAHDEKYLLFKTKFLYRHKLDVPEDAERVIIRVSDFAKRSPKIAKQLKAYLESSDRNDPDLAKRLPTIITRLRPEQLRVCEAAVQLEFLSFFAPPTITKNVMPKTVENRRTVIDLFAGCGGMSLGFEMAGYRSVLAVEKDAWAAETYARNRADANVVTADITKIPDPRKSFPEIKDVFGIIGGPPCQGFSVSGGRDPKDPRNSLFMDYMRFVKTYNPSFFVMENVPGILSSVTRNGEKVKDVIMSVAKGIGYNVHVVQLNAADYGVPQSRVRVFFFGIRNDYPFKPLWLAPEKISTDSPVTIRAALSDLPVIESGGGQPEMEYPIAPENPYQEWCRMGSGKVSNHVAMRHTQRLVDRFHVIKWGESAADVPHEHMQRKRGNAGEISGKIYSQNNMRPFPDRPSPTVPASFQSNFVHPLYDRNYTAREGARLQSFPDTYVFCGKRTTMSWEKNLSQYQQIGNAVPPLLARAIAKMMTDYFNAIEE